MIITEKFLLCRYLCRNCLTLIIIYHQYLHQHPSNRSSSFQNKWSQQARHQPRDSGDKQRVSSVQMPQQKLSAVHHQYFCHWQAPSMQQHQQGLVYNCGLEVTCCLNTRVASSWEKGPCVTHLLSAVHLVHMRFYIVFALPFYHYCGSFYSRAVWGVKEVAIMRRVMPGLRRYIRNCRMFPA